MRGLSSEPLPHAAEDAMHTLVGCDGESEVEEISRIREMGLHR